jgi:ankyrin repeat protein
MTPLMVASLRGSRDIVVHLIKYGANVSLSDIKGYGTFQSCSLNFSEPCFYIFSNTALQLACMKQRFHVIDALIQNKANPNDVNMSGWNCLISAVNYFHEDSATMLLLLLQVTHIFYHYCFSATKKLLNLMHLFKIYKDRCKK